MLEAERRKCTETAVFILSVYVTAYIIWRNGKRKKERGKGFVQQHCHHQNNWPETLQIHPLRYRLLWTCEPQTSWPVAQIASHSACIETTYFHKCLSGNLLEKVKPSRHAGSASMDVQIALLYAKRAIKAWTLGVWNVVNRQQETNKDKSLLHATILDDWLSRNSHSW